MDIKKRSRFFIHATSLLKSNMELNNRYVSKIVFTYILGYKVDIGHMEAVNLISSHKYSEKQIVRSLPSVT